MLELPEVEGRWSINFESSKEAQDEIYVTLTLKSGVNAYMETFTIVLGYTAVEDLNESLRRIAQQLLLKSQMLERLNALRNQFPPGN